MQQNQSLFSQKKYFVLLYNDTSFVSKLIIERHVCKNNYSLIYVFYLLVG